MKSAGGREGEEASSVMASDLTSENKPKALAEEKSPLPSSTTQNVPSSTNTSQNSSAGNTTTTSKTDSKVCFGGIEDLCGARVSLCVSVSLDKLVEDNDGVCFIKACESNEHES